MLECQPFLHDVSHDGVVRAFKDCVGVVHGCPVGLAHFTVCELEEVEPVEDYVYHYHKYEVLVLGLRN